MCQSRVLVACPSLRRAPAFGFGVGSRDALARGSVRCPRGLAPLTILSFARIAAAPLTLLLVANALSVAFALFVVIRVLLFVTLRAWFVVVMRARLIVAPFARLVRPVAGPPVAPAPAAVVKAARAVSSACLLTAAQGVSTHPLCIRLRRMRE